LGRALLRRLWADPAWAGVSFYLAGRDPDVLEDLSAQASATGCSAIPWVLDLAAVSEEDEAGLRELPPLKGFVFAAGAARDQVLALMDEAAFDRVLAVNLGGHARLLNILREPGRLAEGARGAKSARPLMPRPRAAWWTCCPWPRPA
jgi:NAD(P)-dependent dehydrogenase (short-subunit alcohol dehydrogenase family)